jgi:hypothetical protein
MRVGSTPRAALQMWISAALDASTWMLCGKLLLSFVLHAEKGVIQHQVTWARSKGDETAPATLATLVEVRAIVQPFVSLPAIVEQTVLSTMALLAAGHLLQTYSVCHPGSSKLVLEQIAVHFDQGTAEEPYRCIRCGRICDSRVIAGRRHTCTPG